LGLLIQAHHTSSVERFSENFDQEAMTHLIFFLGRHWFLKKIPEPLLRSPRSLRSNDLETQNAENSKWKLVKTKWNPKFGLSDLKNDLLTSMNSEGAQWPQRPWRPQKGLRAFFQKLHFWNQCIPMKKMRCVTASWSKFSLNLYTEEVCHTIAHFLVNFLAPKLIATCNSYWVN
jgi:hypothetical protein